MHRLCSRRFHRFLKRTISEESEDIIDEVIGDEKSIVIDKHCEGYCWKNVKILVENCSTENSKIDTIFHKIAFADDLASIHHINWLEILYQAARHDILKNITLFNKYNNRFKRILKLDQGEYGEYIINDLSSRIVLPHLWYMTVFNIPITNMLNDGYSEIPGYIHLIHDNDQLCLSFIQRRSSEKFVSPSKTKIRSIDKLIKICCKTFTTKNLTKLLSYHI